MRGWRSILWLALALPAAVAAQPATEAPCPAGSALKADATLIAATEATGLAMASLAPGQTVSATLPAASAVHYPLAPGKAGDAASRGGLLGLTIAQAGTYRVALGAGAWIDMVRDGQAVASIAHSPAPPCSGFHKQVDFPLAPGRYTLQLSASPAPTVLVRITRQP